MTEELWAEQPQDKAQVILAESLAGPTAALPWVPCAPSLGTGLLLPTAVSPHCCVWQQLAPTCHSPRAAFSLLHLQRGSNQPITRLCSLQIPLLGRGPVLAQGQCWPKDSASPLETRGACQSQCCCCRVTTANPQCPGPNWCCLMVSGHLSP